MLASIQFSSISSCSGVKPTAPSTPNPPALLTATTTSRQCVNAKIGNSMPSWSHSAVCMPAPQGRCGNRTCSSLVPPGWTVNARCANAVCEYHSTSGALPQKDRNVTHWLDHSLVLASDYRVPGPENVSPLLHRRQQGLAELGAHHALVYTSTTERGRVLVVLAVNAREPVLDVM